MPALKRLGAAALSAFGFGQGGVTTVTANYLIVAGGGGGGGVSGGGGGAGGLLSGIASLDTTQTYTITVGAGGAGATAGLNNGYVGSNSTAFSLTSLGGGYGAGAGNVGGNGGSGGGGSAYGLPARAGGTGTSGQGNNGGSGNTDNTTYNAGGGGGGAGATGTSALSNNASGAAGGVGVTSSISGSSVYYAGGGGGGGNGNQSGVGGAGGNGGGGHGAYGTSGNAPLGFTGTAGTSNTGGGGGGGGSDGTSGSYSGFAGGSGIVIISYTGAQQFGGGVVTTAAGNTIHTFYTSGTLSPLSSLSASYLIVAGGGSGGYYGGGGGGAGGLLSGSALTIDTNSTYLVTVGAGGAGVGSPSAGNNGSNSTFSMVATVAIGGGGGGGNSATVNGKNGGSGGGASFSPGGSTNSAGTGTSGQGNNGGSAASNGAGGGGGAGAVGGNASGGTAGNGGIGVQSSISGTATYYAGGGGGYGDTTKGSGGSGGGGSGFGTDGTVNTGGGGGGWAGTTTNSGSGGSGIVIIAYAGSTQQMAGGNVTITGGNVIHTFTSSGYLTPLTYFGNSLRFRSSVSAALTRTPTVASNRTTWTWSAWVKKGTTSGYQNLFSAGTAAGSNSGVSFHTDSNSYSIDFYAYNGGYTARLLSSQLMRDYAAWYHIVAVYDSTQATSSNRMKLYLNGVQMTAFSTATYPSQNVTTDIDNTTGHYLGNIQNTNYFDGYMTNINFIDGQALAPTAFGAFNSYGVWQPVTYGGSYGTNGFFLPFTNTANTTALCYDFSPQGNNWTPNNISLTAGSTYDSMTDVPTLSNATSANYPVLNPLSTTAGTFSAANLQFVGPSGWRTALSTISIPTTGKWYAEATVIGNVYTPRGPTTGNNAFGVVPTTTFDSTLSPNINALGLFIIDSGYYNNFTTSATDIGSAVVNGDVLAIAVDTGANTFTLYKNNTSVASGTINTTAGTPLSFAISSYYGTYSPLAANFGQRPFAYTPPTGYVALNTYNM